MRTQSTDSSAAPTGIFFSEQTVPSLIDATKKFMAVEDEFDPYEIRKNAKRFSIERFRKEFKGFVDERISG